MLRNGWSIAGALLTTVTAVVFLVVLLADQFGLHTNPYWGIVSFVVLPVFFVLGLLLIPFGGWLERQRQRGGRAPAAWPRLDLSEPASRQRALLLVALTAANLVIIALASYRGVEYMDTPQFCGQICHQVMKPEFVAYQSAPHARVACVECHVAPGAAGLAESKLSGVRRVLAVLRNSHARPIRPLLAGRLPSGETCERCHWPETTHRGVIKRIAAYANDETNSETVTTLRLKDGVHVNVAGNIEYLAADERAETIAWVRLEGRNGVVREYARSGAAPEAVSASQRRRMDCIDCHNRPSHPIAPSATRAVDEQLALGAIPKDLPFVRRESVRALETTYPTEGEAMAGIVRALGDFYRGVYKDLHDARRSDVDRAVQAVQGVYQRNVFPEMRVTFGTYPNHIGHVDAPGCFRCHNDELVAGDGRTIGQECGTCHSIE